MPIRTHRGRAAVYRTIWGWPLRSPKHLIVTTVVLAVAVTLIAFALPGTEGPRRPVASSSTTSSERHNPFDPSSRSAEADDLTSGSPSADQRAPAEALAVARTWVRAFLTVPDGASSAQWAEQLRPYTTAEIFPELQTVDPANVPNGRITGEPRTISSGAGSAEIDVPTSVTVVRLLVVNTPSGWRIAGYEQAG